MSEQPRLIILMGVSGCGKTVIGEKLAKHLGVEFIDGDDLHPHENIEKMRSGTPLEDADRWPWFQLLAKAMLLSANQNGQVVVACSALKRSYRDYLTKQVQAPVQFVLLHGPKKLIAERQARRHGHFMPEGLLDSQFATLEMPEEDERILLVDVDQTIDAVVSDTLRKLQLD